MLISKSGLLLVLVHAVAATLPARADDWQRLAKQIPHLDYSDFLYNRTQRAHPAGQAALDAALAVEADLGELKERAEHNDPRVRTLALLKLYESGDPQGFRVIHTRLQDEGLAFPGLVRFSQPVMDFRSPPKVPTAKYTVGQVAGEMMAVIGFPWGGDFETWAKPRLDNPDWLGWYEFLLKRVTRGTSPTPEGIDEDLAEFEKLLDSRPPAMRAWLGFVAADEAMMIPMKDTILGTRDELIEKGKTLGPDVLLAFLRDGARAGLKHPTVDDGRHGKRFVLRHARKFFRPADADALHKMGHFIAAADVRPDMASVWLREALAVWDEAHQGWDRAMAMAALLDLAGEKELAFVIDWFYATEPISSGTSDHTDFIKEYERRRPENWKKCMTAVVAHPGFDSMDTMALMYLGLMMNHLNDKELLDNEILSDNREPELRNVICRYFGLEEKAVKWIDLEADAAVVPTKWIIPMDGTPTRMVISPDGELLAIVMRDGQIRIHRASDGGFVGAIPAPGREPTGIAFHRENGQLMVIRATGKMEFWDAGKVLLVEEKKIAALSTTEVCLDPSGRWLGSRTANDVGISVYDLQKGGLRWNMPMGVRAFGMIGVSPDGSRFAVCNGFDRRVWLFDPASAKPVARLHGHSGVPNEVAFSADGSTMVTTGDDTKIMLWNTITGDLISEYANTRRHPRVQPCGGHSRRFFFGNPSGGIPLVDLADGRVARVLKFDGTWMQVMACANRTAAAVVHTKNGESALVGWSMPLD